MLEIKFYRAIYLGSIKLKSKECPCPSRCFGTSISDTICAVLSYLIFVIKLRLAG